MPRATLGLVQWPSANHPWRQHMIAFAVVTILSGFFFAIGYIVAVAFCRKITQTLSALRHHSWGPVKQQRLWDPATVKRCMVAGGLTAVVLVICTLLLGGPIGGGAGAMLFALFGFLLARRRGE